jgi:hypothetical protein
MRTPIAVEGKHCPGAGSGGPRGLAEAGAPVGAHRAIRRGDWPQVDEGRWAGSRI